MYCLYIIILHAGIIGLIIFSKPGLAYTKSISITYNINSFYNRFYILDFPVLVFPNYTIFSNYDCGYANTTGISLYRDNLYRNLYVMPISDIWNHIYIVNV